MGEKFRGGRPREYAEARGRKLAFTRSLLSVPTRKNGGYHVRLPAPRCVPPFPAPAPLTGAFIVAC